MDLFGTKRIKELSDKYKDITDIDQEVAKRKADLDALNSRFSELEKEYKEKNSVLNQDYVKHKTIYDNLQQEGFHCLRQTLKISRMVSISHSMIIKRLQSTNKS